MAENNNQTGMRVLMLFVAVLTIVGGNVGTYKLLQNQMDSMYRMQQLQIDTLQKTAEEHILRDGHPIYHSAKLKDINERMERIEARIEGQINNLDAKLQIEVGKVEASSGFRAERDQARLAKLEEWQKWWYREVQPMIDMHEASIVQIKEKKE